MIKFNIPVGQRFLLFVCITLICCLAGGFVAVLALGAGDTASRVNIATVVQDLMMFILPAVATAMIITRRPADFLQVSRRPDMISVLLVVVTLMVSVPVMNCIIDWNDNIRLPESMSGLEQWLRASEDSAAEMIGVMMSGKSVMSLVVCVLTMGVLAGFSEEIFFRGGIQRLMTTARVNTHVAVWIAAVIFSAAHMQFYGFVPRMLLGAFFGYLAVWSGSLWLAVIAHAANNIMACVSMWLVKNEYVSVDVNAIGVGDSAIYWPWIVLSASLTIGFIGIIYRRNRYVLKRTD